MVNRLTVNFVSFVLLFPILWGCTGKQTPSNTYQIGEPIYREIDSKLALNAEAEKLLQTVRKDPATREARLVAVQPSRKIRELLGSSTKSHGNRLIEMQLAPGLKLLFAGNKFETTGKFSYRWFGKLDDAKGSQMLGSAVLGDRSGDIFGSFFVNGRQFEFYSISSGLAMLREIDETAFPSEHPPEFKLRHQVESKRQVGNTHDFLASSNLATTYTITVLVPYTRAAERQIKRNGYRSVDHFVEASIQSANLVYTNSEVNVRLSIAKTYLILDYAETGNWNVDRDRFFNHAGVRRERLASHADIAVLLFDDSVLCGEVQHINATFDTAFAVVAWNCSIVNLSFVHEVGHLQGADHSDVDAAVPPAYPFGLGYAYRGRWRTVMVYPHLMGPRLPYFSNPLIIHPRDRVPMGDSTHDNARVLRATAKRISELQ